MDTFIFLGFNLYAWITIVMVLTMFTVMLFTKEPEYVADDGQLTLNFI